VKIIIIASVANNNVIGANGKVPWHSKTDLEFFKKTTIDHPVIMGKNTFFSIGKLLQNRLNIIISKSLNEFDGALVFNDITPAFEFCRKENYDSIYIIGGESIYRQCIFFADELIISRFNFEIVGDKFFPAIDDKIWENTSQIDFNDFSVYYYHRKKLKKNFDE